MIISCDCGHGLCSVGASTSQRVHQRQRKRERRTSSYHYFIAMLLLLSTSLHLGSCMNVHVSSIRTRTHQSSETSIRLTTATATATATTSTSSTTNDCCAKTTMKRKRYNCSFSSCVHKGRISLLSFDGKCSMYQDCVSLHSQIDDNNDGDGNNTNHNGEELHDQKQQQQQQLETKKTMSRLAMAAADWLDEEGEVDELSKYWDNFERNKYDQEAKLPSSTTSVGGDGDNYDKLINNQEYMKLSTEQKLNQYYQSRGIDKSLEKETIPMIQKVLQQINNISLSSTTSTISSPQEAIELLESIRPYIQPNTKIGGEALLELCIAYISANHSKDKNNDDNKSYNCNEEKIDEIWVMLKDNPHRDIQLKLKQMKKDPIMFNKEYGDGEGDQRTNGFWFFGNMF